MTGFTSYIRCPGYRNELRLRPTAGRQVIASGGLIKILQNETKIPPVSVGQGKRNIERHAVPDEIKTLSQIGVPTAFPSGGPSNSNVDSSSALNASAIA